MNISQGIFPFQFIHDVRKVLLPSSGDSGAEGQEESRESVKFMFRKAPLFFFPEPMYFVRSYAIRPDMNFVKLVFIRKLPLPSRERGGVRGNRNEKP